MASMYRLFDLRIDSEWNLIAISVLPILSISHFVVITARKTESIFTSKRNQYKTY